MRLSRDISGHDLVKYLKPYGYMVTPQVGSYICLATMENGQHHITIPAAESTVIGGNAI